MIKSMTGYGSASINNELLTMFVEVKSLNSKSLDLYLKTPRTYSEIENEIRNVVLKHLDRGKVSITVEVEYKTIPKPKITFNKEIIKAYYNQIKDIASELNCEQGDFLRMAFSLPDSYVQNISEKVSEEELKIFWDLLEKALIECTKFRIHEGEVLKSKLSDYIHQIYSGLNMIEKIDPLRIDKIRDKLVKNLDEYHLSSFIDKNRFEQEMIYYIEKLDIKEELVRLRKHLDYFLECLNFSDGNGKKLGFIAQEIGREINTIGSKANDADIQKFVVNMKEELEKIKEQCLNIL